MVPANICCQVEPDAPVSETRPQASSETGEGACEADGKALAHLLALCGNSLLKPMRRDAAYGLSPSFWRELSVDHPNKTVDEALRELAVFAEAACATLSAFLDGSVGRPPCLSASSSGGRMRGDRRRRRLQWGSETYGEIELRTKSGMLSIAVKHQCC